MRHDYSKSWNHRKTYFWRDIFFGTTTTPKKKNFIESKKMICLEDFLCYEKMMYLNEIKFVWFKQSVIEKIQKKQQIKICSNQINFCLKSNKFIFKKNLFHSSIYLLSKSESVKFSLIESVTCLFTDSPVKKYFSLSNQLIFTEIISEIWLIYSNLFLAISISKISLKISRFWLIQI